jgi:serine protease Do
MKTKKFIRSKWFLPTGLAVLTLAAGLFIGHLWLPGYANAIPPLSSRPPATPADYATGQAPAIDGLATLQNLQNAFRTVAARVLPTVVEIDVVDVVKQTAPVFPNPFEFFFGPGDGDQAQPRQREFRRQGLGSGVVVRQSGSKVYVLTNNHVAGDATEISVKLSDGRTFKGKLVGKDEHKDLALVEFESRASVPVAELGDSNSLQVGDLVLAVGSPLGFESTVTSGIVSAIGRRSMPGAGVGGFTDYIQTDAAINQGNSGGALVNIYGQVVGLNTWIASTSGGNIGLGFAIPINNAKRAINDFITKGRSEYGWIGINMGNVLPSSAADLKLKDSSGAFVYGVFKGSPAEKAGLLPGDLITKVNGQPLNDSSDLMMTIGELTPGKSATLDLLRYGEPQRLTIQIGSRADEKQLAAQASKVWPGFSVVKLTDDIRQQLNLQKVSAELVIGAVDQGSPADIAGLRAGDLIVKVGGREVKTLSDFYKTLNNSSSREIMFAIQRQDTNLIIGLVR